MVDILNRIVYNYNCKNKPTGRKEERMFDKEISHYNVIISDFVSSAGKFIRLKSVKCYSEDEAVRLARDFARDFASETTKFKVRIEQVCNIVGWWED